MLEKQTISAVEIDVMVKELTKARDLLTSCLRETKKIVSKQDYKFYRTKTFNMNHEIHKVIIKLLKFRLVKAKMKEWLMN